MKCGNCVYAKGRKIVDLNNPECKECNWWSSNEYQAGCKEECEKPTLMCFNKESKMFLNTVSIDAAACSLFSDYAK